MITPFAQTAYEAIAQNATKDLMTFLSSIKPDTLCVTYFDEADEMDRTLLVLLHLLQYQDTRLRMWFIFMGTKSSIDYYAPSPNDCQFLSRLYSPDLFKIQWVH